MEGSSTTGPSRRQRVRDATLRELIAVSREILTTQGAEALTIRAVAREMGMTPPGVYRYFDGHRALLDAVIVAILDELTEFIAARTDEVDEADTAGRLVVASRALRRWGVEHPREFHLSLVVSPPEEENQAVGRARRQVGRLFGEIFAGAWRDYGSASPAPWPRAPRIEPLAERLVRILEVSMPSTAAAAAFTRCWMRLYGMVCLESLGLPRVVGDEKGDLFEAELAELARALGLPETALDTGR
ncbi:TetR family transcriptional regulator [Microbispora bryophytorum]|uniref:TetR family transcriptional regulator n=2 Tax=Microbispora bryophytorum TaxID=1460882 RepID=A0A8H9L8S3_9ACTN|nr:TetR family transcriptional regulator [Microbispora bryophytorum]